MDRVSTTATNSISFARVLFNPFSTLHLPGGRLSAASDETNGAREWFELALSRAGIVNFRWHDLWHTFASRVVIAGVGHLHGEQVDGS
jgi:hypothetical protein